MMGIVSIASDFNRRTTGLFKMVLITSGMMGIVSIAIGFNRRKKWIFCNRIIQNGLKRFSK